MPTPRLRHREPPRSKSGLKGVIFCPNAVERPWKAYGRLHGMYLTLGRFQTRAAAARAYNAWAAKRYGPSTFLNSL